jgi:glycosyltransferase involved in cell wall biosynthesis
LRSPDVAFLLPIARAARWLPECLSGLASQTYDNFEIVAVLDGACPINSRVLRESGLEDRLKVVTIQHPGGVANALNRGLRETMCEFVARIDADDVCHPHRLETQLTALRDDPGLWVLGGAARIVDHSGAVVGRRSVPAGSANVHRRLRWRNAVIHPTVMMRRQSILTLGGYDSASIRMEDYVLWLRVTAMGRVDNLPGELIDYRIHDSQHSAGKRLVATSVVRDARRAAATGLRQRIAADLRHAAWLSAQFAHERRH